MSSLIPNWWFRGPQTGNGPEAMTNLQREIQRFFEEVGRSPGLLPFGGAEVFPRLSVRETGDAVLVEAELPGLAEKDVDLELRADRLTIRGERQDERSEAKDDVHIQERMFGSFTRTISLPFAPDPKAVKAAFQDGVLKITLPKPPEVKQHTHKIPVVRT